MKAERSTPWVRQAPSRTMSARKAAEAMTVTARKAAKAQARAAAANGGTASGAGSFRERLDWRWLCGLVRARGVPEIDVEDIAQEVLVSASSFEPGWQPRHDQTPRQARRQLLRRVVGWQVNEYLRQRRRRCALHARYERTSTEPRHEPSVEQRWIERSRTTALHAALERLAALGKCYAAAVTLHVREELTAADVAAALQLPRHTAVWRLRTGLSALRAMLRCWQAQERFAA
jgi:DNA-directed RNA polymerase specialized sigma24 family protein